MLCLLSPSPVQYDIGHNLNLMFVEMRVEFYIFSHPLLYHTQKSILLCFVSVENS